MTILGLSIGNTITGFLRAAGEFLYGLGQTLGGPGLFFVALADSSFLSVPEGNDLLIVVLSTGQRWETMLYYVAMTVAGSVVGCSLLYWVGHRGGSFLERRTRRETLERVSAAYDRWGIWAVMIPSVLPPPTPFKVFVLSAGIFRIRFRRFLLAVSVGRTFRYLMWGVLAVLYGEWAKRFIHENLTTVGVVLVLVIMASIAGYSFWRYSTRKAEPEVL